MKPQDFMEALGGVSQEKLDALAKWQEAGTPITGKAPAREKRITQTAAESVPAQRRRETMKQKVKKTTPVTRLFPWNIGIGAAVAACAVLAVSVGKEAIARNNQMQVGSNAGISVTEQLSEREPLPIEVRAADGIDIDMNLPAGGKAQVLRSIGDAQPWIDLLKQSGEYGRETGEGFHPCLEILLENEKRYLDRDIIICAVPYRFVQGDSGVAQHAFFGGTITESGKLTVDTGMVTVSKEMRPLMLQDTKAYCICFTVPKNTVPEITGFTFNNQIYDCTAPLPDDIRSEHDMTGYLAELPEYQAYAQRFTNELYLRWAEDEIQTADAADLSLPEDCKEVQAAETEILPEPFSAWYWVSYHGTSIPLEPRIDEKCAATADLIRTAADGEQYLTGDPEQNQTALHTQLSKEWLETGFDEQQITDPVSGTVFSIDPDHPVQDMLFIGVPACAMPDNVVRWAFHNGTITPSGKLHLDFSVQTVSDTAIKALNTEYNADTNFYFFISIPDGSIPELTDWDITFSTYYTSAEPDAYTAEAPEKIGLDGMNRRDSWLSRQPESVSYWNSVLGAKYITPIPEKQPDTVTLTDISACLIEETPLENKPFFSCLQCGETDNITLTLPVHDADVAVALSDLHVSADGILSLTLNEYYEKRDVDLTQDTACFQWVLGVPHGSLPEIKDMVVNRVICENEDAFRQIAGQLCTVTTE